MPYMIREKTTGRHVAGFGGRGKIDWVPDDFMSWRFGDRALAAPFWKTMKGLGYDVEIVGEDVKPKKQKEEEGKAMAGQIKSFGSFKECKVCGKVPKKDKKMFGFEAWEPHDFVRVCSSCVYEIVTEHLAEENE